jgi:hypothetical protein
VLQDPVLWQQSIDSYVALAELRGGVTPQARGQRFNGLVAQLLTSFGIPARSDQRSVGEVDVTFTFGGRRFILEAKWEKRKSDTGYVAKLQRRVEQRMSGLTGVFLSMNGYSPDALEEVTRGRRLDVLLIDQTHWEAMLCGLVPPPEMLDLITDAASFQGRAYTPLAELLRSPDSPPKVVSLDGAATGTATLRTAPEARATPIIAGLNAHCTGLSSTGQQAVVTTDHGIAGLDMRKQVARWLAPVDGCHGTAIARTDGTVLFTRGHGVGVFRDGQITALAGISTVYGAGRLLRRDDDTDWCIDTSDIADRELATNRLNRLGSSLAETRRDDQLQMPAAAAAWLHPSTLVAGVSNSLVFISPGQRSPERISVGAHAVVAVAGFGAQRVVAATASGHVCAVDRSTQRVRAVASFEAATASRVALTAEDTGAALVLLCFATPSAGHLAAIARLEMSAEDAPDLRASGAAPPPPAGLAGDRLHDATVVTAAAETFTGRVQMPVPGQATVGQAVQPRSRHMLVPEPVSRELPAMRAADQRRGERDGIETAARLPLVAFEGLIAAHFDAVRWLDQWRERWQFALTQPARFGTEVPPWLQQLARYLGGYAAPPMSAYAALKPTPAYLAGFSIGLRSAWIQAVKARIVPADRLELLRWFTVPPAHWTQRTPLHDATLNDLHRVRSTTRRKIMLKGLLRAALWVLLAFLLLMEVAAIAITIDGSWTDRTGQPAANQTPNAIIANLLCGLPIIALTTFLVIDIWRRRRRAKTQAPPAPRTPQ